ncbi:MAG: putative DNA-binding domain-containing protein [Chlamydiota bacterium]
MPFADTIAGFTACCLKKDSTSKPGRIGVYQNLIRNNIEDTLIKGYPLTYDLLSSDQWNTLVEDFIARGKSTSPFLWKMPEAFYHFAKKHSYQQRWNIPFLEDLLHFEWIEIELFMQKDHPLKPFTRDGDVLSDCLYLNPESKLLHYHYPVFEKLSTDTPPALSNYSLFGYRHPDTSQVHFISLSPLFALAFEQLTNTPTRGEDAILNLIAGASDAFRSQALAAARIFFTDLLEQRAILGFLRSSDIEQEMS